MQRLKEPEAVVSESLLQIQCLIQSFKISVLLTFWAGSFFAVGAVVFMVGGFNSIAGLCPFDISNNLRCGNQKCFETFPNVCWEANHRSWGGLSLKAILCCYRTFLLPTHCPKCSHMTIPNCKGGWVTQYLLQLDICPFKLDSLWLWHMFTRELPSLLHVWKEKSRLKYLWL